VLDFVAARGGVVPAALWVRGAARLDQVIGRAVAIAGATNATPYGAKVAVGLARGLAVRGWSVVSGGFYGIEGAAHRGALTAGGVTVAVVTGGALSPYPPGHKVLFDRIVSSGGLVVSEYGPDVPPSRAQVAARDRLVAALVCGVIVVESAALPRPASLAGQAERLGRALMAVPGPVDSAGSAGCLRLIQQGKALLVTNTEDVVEIIEPLHVTLSRAGRMRGRP
jgi:DNA processing protein